MINDSETFSQQIDKNFSVQASAGTGKTHSLIERMVTIALRDTDRLSRLVVATYTNRAANEMQQRLRERLLSSDEFKGSRFEIERALSKMFIGTIHSFAVHLIAQYAALGGYAATPTPIMGREEEVYQNYLRQKKDNQKTPPWETLSRFVTLREILLFAKSLSELTVDWELQKQELDPTCMKTLEASRLDPSVLDSVKVKKGSSQLNADHWKAQWKAFAKALEGEKHNFALLPLYDGKAGKAFKEMWEEKIAPFSKAFMQCLTFAAVHEAAAYQNYRFERGELFFSDQTILARRLFDVPEIRHAILQKEYCVLLDEAQDTDPVQFEFLLEISRDKDSSPFLWGENGEDAPPPGRFSMVGDLQQSIYRKRASLSLYQKYHQALESSPHGEALSFHHTYRCRPAIVSFVTQCFQKGFDGKEGQVDFVELTSKGKGSGQVVFWQTEKLESENTLMDEALQIAQRLKHAGLKKLRASSWGEVAILYPKKKQLLYIEKALKKVGLPCMMDFPQERYLAPEYLWLTALLTIMDNPNDEFEIVGVLREIYAISDEEIYRYKIGDAQSLEKDGLKKIVLENFDPPKNQIQEVLSSLWKTRKECAPMLLSEKVAFWVKSTMLEEKLLSLPNGQTHCMELDKILFMVHEVQQSGKSLKNWVQELRNGILQKQERLTFDQKNKIQIMTIQKSKGLQWDAVILPFLGVDDSREGGVSEFPRIEWLPGFSLKNSSPPPSLPLLWRKSWKSSEWNVSEAKSKNSFLQERKRFYYVACTRARHTLILLDDQNLCRKKLKDGTLLSSSHGYSSLFSPADPRKDSINLKDFGLSEELSEDSTMDLSSKKPIQIPADDWNLSVSDEALPKKREEETPSSSQRWFDVGASDALVYGQWWHDTLKIFPWEEHIDQIKKYLQTSLSKLFPSSLQKRGEEEIEKFLSSTLYQRIKTLPKNSLIAAEVTYSRMLAKGQVEDARIDLIFQEQDGLLTLLDWKTDIEKNGDPPSSSDLIKRHRSQLANYSAALESLGYPISSQEIYSTVSGEIVVVPKDLS